MIIALGMFIMSIFAQFIFVLDYVINRNESTYKPTSAKSIWLWFFTGLFSTQYIWG